jgi:hypothetical protein
MLQKLYDYKDILYYFSEYLTFNEKLTLQNIFQNVNFIKNHNFYDKKNNKKTLFNIKCICDNCYIELSCDQSFHLSSKYENFLYDNDIDTESDSEYSSENENPSYFVINPYQNIYEASRMRDENEFILSNYYHIAIRSFIEILDQNNITVDIYNIKCIFELDFDKNIYNQIYSKIDEIYIYGIKNKCLDIFCEKCGIFGHSNETKNCILFNKTYEKHIVKKELNYLMNDLINNIIDRDKEEKRQQERMKKLCYSCKHNFFSNKCEKKMCKSCCNCYAHKKVKNKNNKK